MAQLIIIPAVIALAAIALVALFGSLAGKPDNLTDLLARLRQSVGHGGRFAGAQDPRYKEGCNAAYNIATLIPTIKNPAERRGLSRELMDILRNAVKPENVELQKYLVLALGALAQEGAFDAILAHAESPDRTVREAVVVAILSWSDSSLEEARRGLPALTKMLSDRAELVRTQAAISMWKLARPTDAAVIAGLREAMASAGWDEGDGQKDFVRRNFTYTRWNAAMSLAALNDEQGIAFVADTLLNRAALAKVQGDVTGDTNASLTEAQQERVLASALSMTSKMTDERIWRRVKELAESDRSAAIKKAASQIMQERKK